MKRMVGLGVALALLAGSAMANPLPGASTDASGTVTTGAAYQTVFPSNAYRGDCTIQNPNAATEVLSVKAGTTVYTLAAGGVFKCSSDSVVITDQIQVTAATTSHAFSAAQQ